MSGAGRADAAGGVCAGVRPSGPRAGVEGCVIDGHMHVMSGRCTPLPTVWYNGGGLTKFVYYVFRGVYEKIRWGKADSADAWEAYVSTLRAKSMDLADHMKRYEAPCNAAARAILVSAMRLLDCIPSFGWYETTPDRVQDMLGRTDEEIAAGTCIRQAPSGIVHALRKQFDPGQSCQTDIIEATLDLITVGALVADALIAGNKGRGEQTWQDVLSEAVELAAMSTEEDAEALRGDLEQAVRDIAVELGRLAPNNTVDDYRTDELRFENLDVAIEEMRRVPLINLLVGGLAGTSKLLDLQKRTTQRLASLAMLFSRATFGVAGDQEWYPMVALGMDMDFAHLDGYNGNPIYEEVAEDDDDGDRRRRDGDGAELPVKRYQFYRRRRADSRGRARRLDEREGAWYEDWKAQIDDTLEAVKRYPWRLLPLYHYDPRRWKNGAEEAFDHVMHVRDEGKKSETPRAFVGFKMYPALGYKPLDKRLPKQKNFYSQCEELEIPIVTHCSPGGLSTHDRELYYEYDCLHGLDESVRRRYDELVEKHWRSFLPDPPIPDPTSLEVDGAKRRAERQRNILYFQEEYGSVEAWVPVLEEHPRLRLCLAHFGGRDRNGFGEAQSGWDCDDGGWDGFPLWNERIIELICGSDAYPNLYTDISYFPCLYGALLKHGRRKLRARFRQMLGEYPRLWDRVLFGTDWYMMEREARGLDLQQYCRETRDMLLEITEELTAAGKYPPNHPDLWTRFAVLNPFRFYQIEGIRVAYSEQLKGMTDANKKKIEHAERAIERVAAQVRACEEVLSGSAAATAGPGRAA
ncbi:MAG: amidohydrolase family protein [Chitinivibrionales bacterium]|nr:amidohydrolase family protein [Chitinivibrionales bacterium]